MSMLQLLGLCFLAGLVMTAAGTLLARRAGHPVRGRFSPSQFLLFGGLALAACSLVGLVIMAGIWLSNFPVHF